MYRIIIIRVKRERKKVNRFLSDPNFKFFVHRLFFSDDRILLLRPLCFCSPAMLFFSSSTQLPNSEVSNQLFLLEITIGFGFLNMAKSHEVPYSLGNIRSTEKLGHCFSHIPLPLSQWWVNSHFVWIPVRMESANSM